MSEKDTQVLFAVLPGMMNGDYRETFIRIPVQNHSEPTISVDNYVVFMKNGSVYIMSNKYLINHDLHIIIATFNSLNEAYNALRDFVIEHGISLFY